MELLTSSVGRSIMGLDAMAVRQMVPLPAGRCAVPTNIGPAPVTRGTEGTVRAVIESEIRSIPPASLRNADQRFLRVDRRVE